MKVYSNLDVGGAESSPIPDLYRVKPRNLETGFVESFTGYLIRLAQQHQVIPKVLVQKIIRREFETSESLGSVYGKAYASNGFGEIAEKWTSLFQKQTAQGDLQELTLLDLKNVISRRHLLRKQKAWCPNCLTQWLSEGEELYEPLLWCLEPVKVCPQHEVPLKTECPSCERSVPMMTGRSRIGVCPNCDSWLGQECKENWTVDKWELWIAEEAAKLVDHLPSSTLNSNLVSLRINSILEDNDSLTISGLARRMNLKKNTVWYWSQGKTIPTFRNFLKLCYVLGIGSDKLLSGEFSNEEVELREWEQSDQLERKAPTSVNEDELKELLGNALQSSEAPPSLWQVARNTPHQPRILREHFPELCREVSKRFQEYRHEEFQEKKLSVQKRIRELVESLHQRGIYPSKPKIEEKLSNPGYLNLPKIRQTWKESLQEFGYSV